MCIQSAIQFFALSYFWDRGILSLGVRSPGALGASGSPLEIDTTREAKMSSSPSKQVDCFTIPLYMEMVMVEVFAPRHQTAKPFSNLIDLFSVFVSSISNNRSHYIHLRHNSNFSYHNLSN